jgi:hypothetical protein
MREEFNKRVRRDKRIEKRTNDEISIIPGLDPRDSQLHKEMEMLAKMFPDKKITPYDPKIVAIREQIKRDGLQIKDGQLYTKDGQVINTDPTKPKDSMLTKMDKKFGGSWFIGRLSPWQIVMVISLILGFVYAGRKHRQRTEQLPQKLAAKPMIDFVRTTTLLKYVWTLRLMLEVGALVPLDGTETLQNDAIQADIEKELSELSQEGSDNAQKDDKMAKRLKEHPEIRRNLNFIQAMTILDKELHDLDKELRQSLLDLMELYVSLGRPYADSYSTRGNDNLLANSVDAIYAHSQSTISLDGDVDTYLQKHERMKDALQVLFTRQNSAHKAFGQMFSDVYALTWLKAGVWNLPADDRVMIPDETQFYIQSIGYDIVRVWQDNYVHLLGKKLSKHLNRLAFPSEIVDFGLQTDHRSQSIEPFIRELRKIEPKVIADYNDFLDYNLNISLTDNYKRWWRRMLQNMPRYRRSNDPPATITMSNYTQLFRDYERIFGKVPYLVFVSKEIDFLEKLKDFSLGNQDLKHTLDIIAEMQTTTNLERVPPGQYSVEAVVEGARDKIKDLMDRDFQKQLSTMSYLDERTELSLLRDHEKRVETRQRQMKKHQHTLSLLSVPAAVRTRYLYNLLDIGSPVLQIVNDHLNSLDENGVFFPLYPCVGSFRDFYHTISQSAQVLCQRDQQLVELKRQLGQVYRSLDSKSNSLSEEMKERFIAREKELLAIPDIREYALSMTRDEIARDDRFVYGKTAGLFDLDQDKQRMNIFNEFEDDLTPNHPVNKGERGKIQYQIVLPDPPKHLSHAFWMLDSYVDVRPGRPDHGEDRRAFAARKFNSLRSFMPIPTRYIPQSSMEILKAGERENTKAYEQNNKDGNVETLSQKQVRKTKFDLVRQEAQKSLTVDELQNLQKNKLERLHSIAGANLVKLESCIIQDLVELNSWGIQLRIPLDGLKPNQFKHYIQPPYAILERETVPTSLSHGVGAGTITGIGPANANVLLPTRASLVISGKYKLMDKYHQDLIKLQQQGFPISVNVIEKNNTQNGDQKKTALPLASNIGTKPQHIPSATDITKSGLTPAEYYSKQQLEQQQLLTGQKKMSVEEKAREIAGMLQDETQLRDFSIPIGFPTMSVDGFNELQTQLDQEQNKQRMMLGENVEPSNANIRQISQIAQNHEGNKPIAQETAEVIPSIEDQYNSRLLLPVPLSPISIPNRTSLTTKATADIVKDLDKKGGDDFAFKKSKIDAGMPVSPVWKGEKPVHVREREIEKVQKKEVIQKLGVVNNVDQIKMVDGIEGINNVVKYTAPDLEQDDAVEVSLSNSVPDHNSEYPADENKQSWSEWIWGSSPQTDSSKGGKF